jgi:hypothetical protein
MKRARVWSLPDEPPKDLEMSGQPEAGQGLVGVEEEQLARAQRRGHIDPEGRESLGEELGVLGGGDEHRRFTLLEPGGDVLRHHLAQKGVVRVGLDEVIAGTRRAQHV